MFSIINEINYTHLLLVHNPEQQMLYIQFRIYPNAKSYKPFDFVYFRFGPVASAKPSHMRTLFSY